MEIKIERRDYKTRREFDVFSRRLSSAGVGYVHDAVGAPKENLRVSFRPYHFEKIVAVIKGEEDCI